MSSSTCCSQFLRGRLGGRFQSAAGGVPVWASIVGTSDVKFHEFFCPEIFHEKFHEILIF